MKYRRLITKMIVAVGSVVLLSGCAGFSSPATDTKAEVFPNVNAISPMDHRALADVYAGEAMRLEERAKIMHAMRGILQTEFGTNSEAVKKCSEEAKSAHAKAKAAMLLSQHHLELDAEAADALRAEMLPQP